MARASHIGRQKWTDLPAPLGRLVAGYSQGRGCHPDVEPICNSGRPTCVVRSEERCHEQPHPTDACRLDGQQKDDIEAGFRCRVFDRGCGRHDRLGFGIRLAHRQGSEVAIGLAQISDDVSDLRDPAADHDPESKIHFQRDQHRASPHF